MSKFLERNNICLQFDDKLKMDESNDSTTTTSRLPVIQKCQVYPIRWLILAIFVMYSCVNAMQWIQYSIITDVVIKYYGVSAQAVNWTSMIFMVLYIPFIFPASYLLDKLVS